MNKPTKYDPKPSETILVYYYLGSNNESVPQFYTYDQVKTFEKNGDFEFVDTIPLTLFSYIEGFMRENNVTHLSTIVNGDDEESTIIECYAKKPKDKTIYNQELLEWETRFHRYATFLLKEKESAEQKKAKRRVELEAELASLK